MALPLRAPSRQSKKQRSLDCLCVERILDLPEQSEQDIPLDEIKIAENKVYLDIGKIQRKFEGEISADRQKIVGFYLR